MTLIPSRHFSLRKVLPCGLLAVLLAACGGSEQQASAGTSVTASTAPTRSADAKDPDHHEFEAVLEAPFVSPRASGGRTFTMRFSYPGATEPHTFAWRLELLDGESRVPR
jgi:hypothetical protein